MYQLCFRLVIIPFVIVFLSLLGCTEGKDNTHKQIDKSHLVEAVTAKRTSMGVERVRTGSLRARREVKIHNQEDGQIIKLPYFEGDLVNKGDVVVQLDDKLLRAQLARAQATRKQAEQDLKRTRNLFSKKLIPDEELNRAETAVQVAKADESVLATRISYTTIRAPITGIVSARLSEPGNIAERYSHILTITDLTSLVTEVTLSELLINQLTIGHPVQVSIDALGSQEYQGKVSRIFPNVDPVTRRGTIEVELSPVPQGVQPGQLCRVRLKTNAAERMTIPFSALRRDTQGEYVFAIDKEGKAERVTVVSGVRIGEQIEILKGLEDNSQVVTKGFLDLESGKKVKVVSATSESSTDKMQRVEPLPESVEQPKPPKPPEKS